jgi:hypothetical protein
VLAAMARRNYLLARIHLHLAHPTTPERVLLFAASELRTNANAAVPLLRRAMRIAEALWVAVRRGDEAALRTPDGWARDYLEGQRDDERLSAVRLLDKSDVFRLLVCEAGRVRGMIEAEEAKRPVSATEGARLVATVMSGAPWYVAPEIVPFAIETSRYEAAKALIASDYERAWERGERLNDEKVARLTLRAFSSSEVAGSYSAGQRMRRKRRREQDSKRAEMAKPAARAKTRR